MQFYSAASQIETTDDAVAAIIRDVRAHLNAVDAVFVFMSADHRHRATELAERIWLELNPQAMIGCTAEGVIGAGREIERSPGITILAAHLPDVHIHPFHIASDDWRQLLSSPQELLDRVGFRGDETRAILAFGDPWTTALNQFLPALDMLAPHAPLIGGMASGAEAVGENILIRNEQPFEEGMVGMSLSGPIAVRSVVSQGARPIGSPMVITKARDNLIEQFGGKPAMEVLRDVVLGLPDYDKQLIRHGLLIGRAISEYRDQWGRGDFLVRSVIGVDADAGAIAIADLAKVGQTVQFHVRDAASATEDLTQLLTSAADGRWKGGLLFSCNGRGGRMFDQPDHDIRIARQLMPQAPMSGFFAAGEIGPVGQKNFVHGHTASFALFGDQR